MDKAEAGAELKVWTSSLREVLTLEKHQKGD
jgi:hypothetical protein